jgi:hypothetical protein
MSDTSGRSSRNTGRRMPRRAVIVIAIAIAVVLVAVGAALLANRDG